MGCDNTILDELLRETEVDVMNFVDLIEEDEFYIDDKGERLCSMFSVFGERLLRAMADKMPNLCHTPLVGDIHELADRIKHRSLMS